jgi:hypothetical protein
MSLLDECFSLAGWVPPAQSPGGDEFVWSEPRGEAAWFVLGPIGFARARACELALARGDAEALAQPRARWQLLGALGKPSARLAIASKDADYATGQTCVLDGGLMMNVGQGA